MSLDIYFKQIPTEPILVHEQNITHNLGKMADAAGLYKALWRPEEIGLKKAKELIPYLEVGIKTMRHEPEKFKHLSAENGWGTYEQFLPWLDELLLKCKKYPEATITVSR